MGTFVYEDELGMAMETVSGYWKDDVWHGPDDDAAPTDAEVAKDVRTQSTMEREIFATFGGKWTHDVWEGVEQGEDSNPKLVLRRREGDTRRRLVGSSDQMARVESMIQAAARNSSTELDLSSTGITVRPPARRHRHDPAVRLRNAPPSAPKLPSICI